MELQTKLNLKPHKHNQIDYHSKLLLIGSCFSEHIAEKLDYFKFQNTSNPFGILFQPLAIEKLLTKAINEEKYTEEDLFFFNEQWHCFDAHSKLSNASKEVLLEALNSNLKLIEIALKNATHVLVTIGTAWVYRYIETDEFVANCHKVPQKKFLKTLLPLDVITQSLQAIVSLVRTINPKVSFLFTVSPVRHLKDGFVENMQSKAHLIAALHQIIDERKQCYYFPSYEILLDELRDYRFYKSDMIHPNAIAVDYIWNIFKSVWISESTNDTMHDIDVIQKGLRHRPFNPKSEAHQTFLSQLKTRQSQVKSKFSHIVF